ncbi:hypothetical protein Aut01nite_61280 [Actinoplanes utahensis]|nr:hypothetical protein Aut01nite_61280 [Actinoplanes utahensis]
MAVSSALPPPTVGSSAMSWRTAAGMKVDPTAALLFVIGHFLIGPGLTGHFVVGYELEELVFDAAYEVAGGA